MEMSQRTAGSAMRLVRRPSRAIIVYLSMSSWWEGGGGEFQLYLTSHFCLGVGNLTEIVWKRSNPHPMPHVPPPPALAGLPLIGAVCYVIFNTVLMHVENPYQF